MHILQVIPYFTFSRGGDVNVCYNLSKQLASLNHKITILTTAFEYDNEDIDSIKNIAIVPIEYKFNLALFIYSPKIKDWLDENISKFDIIHLHELRSYQNNVVIEYAEKYNIPYVVQPHNSTPKHVGKTSIKKVYDVFYGNKIMQNASCVIAVSKEEIAYDRQMKAKEIELVYNGMNLEAYENLPKEGSFRDKHINAPYILYFGRLDKLKGIDKVIRAFASLPSTYDEYKLVIAGKETEYKKELERIIETKNIEDKVVFTGLVKEKDKISIYQDAKVFVNPVKYMGGVSITVLESLLSNTPVIVTKESGELIESMNAGITVKYGNINQLKYAIIESIENDALTKKHIANGREFIHKHLGWETVTYKVLEIYQKAIKNNR